MLEALEGAAVDRLRLVVKREREVDGVAVRVVVDRMMEIDLSDLAGTGMTLPAALVPEGEGLLAIHAVALKDGVVVGVGDAYLGEAMAGGVVIYPLNPVCDADEDTYLDCDNVRAACCVNVPAEVHAQVSDCHDDPEVGARVTGDTKRRDASQAHAFAPFERADDYATCDNGLDDDCSRGDLPCDATLDADEDGATVGVDCDDADPAIHPGAYDIPGDDIDQDCDGQEGQGTDADADGYFMDNPDPALRDCDDANAFVHPGAAEVACNEIDDDCIGGDRCDLSDLDGDGFLEDDCAPNDAGAYPGAPERCGDEIDQDCDGADLPCPAGDLDADGYGPDEDCGEDDPTRYPGAPERCGDAIDQDCDGVDPLCEGRDLDGDGFAPPFDCDDSNERINPWAAEICDQIDNNCNGQTDEGNPRATADGRVMEPTCGSDVGLCQVGPLVCSRAEDDGGERRAEFVCLGAEPSPEVCDGFDNDCDGSVDIPPLGQDRLLGEGAQACGPEQPRGECRQGTLWCQNGTLSACRDAVEPQDELCNLRDDDCDGRIDEGVGGGQMVVSCFDGDEAIRNQGLCRDGVKSCVDGNFTACEGQELPREEACNNLDDDCDGLVDEDAVIECYTFSEETRGVGTCQSGVKRCVDGAFLPECEGQIGPSERICDNLDNDCDGRVDQFTEPCFGADLALDPGMIDEGVCRSGSRVCVQGAWGACLGEVLPEAERCDNLDNDCDGARDEDFDLLTDSSHCGECGFGCQPGEACCDGGCRDLSSTENCGGCGNSCERVGDGCEDAGDGLSCRCGDGPACEGLLHCINAVCQCTQDTDCGDNALCCGGACVPSDFESGCERCGVACDDTVSSTCDDRTCKCGDNTRCLPSTICTDQGAGDFLCAGCVDNSQCGDIEMCCGGFCRGTDPVLRCEGCALPCDLDKADFCQAQGEAARTCVCGDVPGAVPCDLSHVCVDGDQPGQGRCEECRDDADCGAPHYPGRTRCVDNICRACDPDDHNPCNLGQLCCNFGCVATGEADGGRCSACDAGCDEDTSDTCSDRSCGCGENPPCAGALPFCDDPRDRCVECRFDADCGGETPECVNFECERCDPANHDNCAPDDLCCGIDNVLMCTSTSALAGQCESCGVGCEANATNTCDQRSCGCGDGPPCADGIPVCDDPNGRCVECNIDADCNGQGSGNQCFEHQCVACDPGDHAGCGAEQLCCDQGGAWTCQATEGGVEGQCESCGSACGVGADECVARLCGCSGEVACVGVEPFCRNGSCKACRNDRDCAGDELCCAGACTPTGPGAAEQCEACGVACDQTATSACSGIKLCGCGDGDVCAGVVPVCNDNTGLCVSCLDDAHCAPVAGRNECVSMTCVECDPAGHDGCDEASATPFCENNSCRACGNDAECVVRPGDLDECVGGLCKLCDPDGDIGCNGLTPICDNNTFTCRACTESAECGGGACVAGECLGCDTRTDAPCSGDTPICVHVSGQIYQCQACAINDGGDGDCADKDANRGQCLVDGTCAVCESGTDDGCAGDALCCDGGCVGDDFVTGCETCGVGCDADVSDRCVNRTCECGPGAACEGQTPFCLDAEDRCVDCRTDVDCDNARPECVAQQCELCDSADDAGCVADSGAPICGVAGCRACAGNAECAANVVGPVCAGGTGECELCDVADNDGCDANGTSPICGAAAAPSCRGCVDNGECGAGQICVTAGALTGACKTCNPADDEGCALEGATPICGDDATCRACAVDIECGAARPFCRAGICLRCDADTDEGCVANSLAPTCQGADPVCDACQDDASCVGNASGEQCITVGADVGGCRTCDPVDNAGCDAAGAEPLCDPNSYTCTGCSDNADCSGGLFCVTAGAISGACKACDPGDNEGCALDSALPVCGDDGVCRTCAGDGECGGARPFCRVGECVRCDVASDLGCAPGSTTPTCQGADPACGPCLNDLSCDGNINGLECVGVGASSGACKTCDPVDDAGCGVNSNAPVCDEGTYLCRGCTGDLECGARYCVSDFCRLCDPVDQLGCGGATPICAASGTECLFCLPDDTGCVVDSNAPVCAADGLSCIGCVDDADCVDNPSGTTCHANGACIPAG